MTKEKGNIKTDRPAVLVVAGYDQSGGAGVLSDVKTMEAHGVYAYAVCTALTFQHEQVIRRVQWLPDAEVLEQIDICFAARRFDWVKIGICRSIPQLGLIVRHLQSHNPAIRIVLDPVIRASSGRDFWEEAGGGPGDSELFEAMASGCFLLTPNWDEMNWLYPGKDIAEQCHRITSTLSCRIYLKGGHRPDAPGKDELWTGGKVLELPPSTDAAAVSPKHGSGCVLASSLTANLALGLTLPEAARRSKHYIEQFLNSNQSLLGWHHWTNSI